MIFNRCSRIMVTLTLGWRLFPSLFHHLVSQNIHSISSCNFSFSAFTLLLFYVYCTTFSFISTTRPKTWLKLTISVEGKSPLAINIWLPIELILLVGVTYLFIFTYYRISLGQISFGNTWNCGGYFIPFLIFWGKSPLANIGSGVSFFPGKSPLAIYLHFISLEITLSLSLSVLDNHITRYLTFERLKRWMCF